MALREEDLQMMKEEALKMRKDASNVVRKGTFPRSVELVLPTSHNKTKEPTKVRRRNPSWHDGVMRMNKNNSMRLQI